MTVMQFLLPPPVATISVNPKLSFLAEREFFDEFKKTELKRFPKFAFLCIIWYNRPDEQKNLTYFVFLL